MELITYNGEYFERSKLRYCIFLLVVGTVIVGSILFNNLFGAVVVLMLVGGYFFFLMKTSDTLNLKTTPDGIQIGTKFQPRSQFTGFVLEYHTKKQTIHNIVLIDPKGYHIFTINDTTENLKAFITEIGKYLPLLEQYEQGFLEKFSRKIQL